MLLASWLTGCGLSPEGMQMLLQKPAGTAKQLQGLDASLTDQRLQRQPHILQCHGRKAVADQDAFSGSNNHGCHLTKHQHPAQQRHGLVCKAAHEAGTHSICSRFRRGPPRFCQLPQTVCILGRLQSSSTQSDASSAPRSNLQVSRCRSYPSEKFLWQITACTQLFLSA